MSLKIKGATVIDDNRALINITNWASIPVTSLGSSSYMTTFLGASNSTQATNNLGFTDFGRSITSTASDSTARTLLKAVNVQGQQLTGGFTSTIQQLGSPSGTLQLNVSGRNFQNVTNNGAFTMAAPTTSGGYTMSITVVNGANPGAISFTGFSRVIGDPLTTTPGDRFAISILVADSIKIAFVSAAQ